VLPTASVPETKAKQLSDRLMTIVAPELVCTVNVVGVITVTVPVTSVLFPCGPPLGGVGRGRGVGEGREAILALALVLCSVEQEQLASSAPPARMQISFFVFIG
jgi:hypothetical protein